MRDLFTERGRDYLAKFPLSDADRFRVRLLLQELDQHVQRRNRVDRKLRASPDSAPVAERQARADPREHPLRGPGHDRRGAERSGRRPPLQLAAEEHGLRRPGSGIRQSDGRSKHLGITKEGSRLLRWALVQAAWRLVNHTRRWGFLYERLKQRCGAKKAIVAVARRLWCVMVSMLKSGQKYRLSSEALAQP